MNIRVILLILVVGTLAGVSRLTRNVVNFGELLVSRVRGRTAVDCPTPAPPPKKLSRRTTNVPGKELHSRRDEEEVLIFFVRHAQSMSNAINDHPTSDELLAGGMWKLIPRGARVAIAKINAFLRVMVMQVYQLLFADQGRSLMLDYPVTAKGVDQIGQFAWNNRGIENAGCSSTTPPELRRAVLLPPQEANVVFLTSNLRRAQQTAMGGFDHLLEERDKKKPSSGGAGVAGVDQPTRFIVEPLLQESTERVDARWLRSTASIGNTSHWPWLEEKFSGFSSTPIADEKRLDRSYHSKFLSSLNSHYSTTGDGNWVTLWDRMDTFCERLFSEKGSADNYFNYQRSSARRLRSTSEEDVTGEGTLRAVVEPREKVAVIVGHGSFISKFIGRYSARGEKDDFARNGISNLQTLKLILRVSTTTGAPEIVPGSIESKSL